MNDIQQIKRLSIHAFLSRRSILPAEYPLLFTTSVGTYAGLLDGLRT